jgi:hypothetical protein
MGGSIVAKLSRNARVLKKEYRAAATRHEVLIRHSRFHKRDAWQVPLRDLKQQRKKLIKLLKKISKEEDKLVNPEKVAKKAKKAEKKRKAAKKAQKKEKREAKKAANKAQKKEKREAAKSVIPVGVFTTPRETSPLPEKRDVDAYPPSMSSPQGFPLGAIISLLAQRSDNNDVLSLFAKAFRRPDGEDEDVERPVVVMGGGNK